MRRLIRGLTRAALAALGVAAIVAATAQVATGDGYIGAHRASLVDVAVTVVTPFTQPLDIIGWKVRMRDREVA